MEPFTNPDFEDDPHTNPDEEYWQEEEVDLPVVEEDEEEDDDNWTDEELDGDWLIDGDTDYIHNAPNTPGK